MESSGEFEQVGETQIGKSRRSRVGRRAADYSINGLVTLVTLVAGLVGFGIAWGTARAQLEGKVDVSTQVLKDADQDREIDLLKKAMAELVPGVRRIDDRVSKIYCSSIPADKRAGCQ